MYQKQKRQSYSIPVLSVIDHYAYQELEIFSSDIINFFSKNLDINIFELKDNPDFKNFINNIIDYALSLRNTNTITIFEFKNIMNSFINKNCIRKNKISSPSLSKIIDDRNFENLMRYTTTLNDAINLLSWFFTIAYSLYHEDEIQVLVPLAKFQ
jgi:hypothetical protein